MRILFFLLFILLAGCKSKQQLTQNTNQSIRQQEQLLEETISSNLEENISHRLSEILQIQEENSDKEVKVSITEYDTAIPSFASGRRPPIKKEIHITVREKKNVQDTLHQTVRMLSHLQEHDTRKQTLQSQQDHQETNLQTTKQTQTKDIAHIPWLKIIISFITVAAVIWGIKRKF